MSEQPQPVPVAVARRGRRELDEFPNLGAVGVRRVQPECRQPPDDAHGAPREHREAEDGDPQLDLRREVRKRIEEDERADALRVRDGEAEGNGPAERLSNQDGGSAAGRRDIDDALQVVVQLLV